MEIAVDARRDRKGSAYSDKAVTRRGARKNPHRCGYGIERDI